MSNSLQLHGLHPGLLVSISQTVISFCNVPGATQHLCRGVLLLTSLTVGAVGSHQDALESYQKAVALAPSRLIHRVELGRTLHRLGMKKQARQELEVLFATKIVASVLCHEGLLWSTLVSKRTSLQVLTYATSLV